MEQKNKDVETPASSPPAVTNNDAAPSKNITTVARVQRNVAEKLRRDKLNGYISELATIVPIIAKAAKRMDKTSILRLSAAYLRICKSPLSGRKKLKSFKWCPNFLNADQVRDILESVDGFLLVAETSGKILFTSRSVERYLGHQDIDMVGHTFYMFIHPEDIEMVKSEINRLLFAYTKKDSPKPIPRCSFYCRMKEKSQPRSEVQTYQFVHIMGAMTLVEEEGAENSARKATPTFKAFIRIVDADPYNQLSLEEAIADEYVTKHSIDGTIIFADHRISTITGHMPHEVTGFNAYKYIHMEDARVALFAQHLMFSSDKGTGLIVYRLRTSDEKYVYLKSVGSLHRDSSTSQVDYFICINQQLSESEGQAQLKYFTDRYQPHIKGSTSLSLYESVKALQSASCKTSMSHTVDEFQNMNTVVSVHKNVKFKESENNSVPQHQEPSSLNVINTKMRNDTNEPENLSEMANVDRTYLGSSGGPTFVLKTPVISSKCNENQLERSSVANCHVESYSNGTFVTKAVNGHRILDTDYFCNGVNRNIPTSISDNSQAVEDSVPLSSVKNYCCSDLKTSIDLSPMCNVTGSIISSIPNESQIVCLATTSDQNSDLKVIKLNNVDLFHIINKSEENMDVSSSVNHNSNVYCCEESNSFCSDNLQLLEDFQKGATDMCVDNNNFFVKTGDMVEPVDPSVQIHSLPNDKDSCSDNTQSSTLDSDDSETITLMSPMCPLRKGLDLNSTIIRVNSPSSSMDFCDANCKQNEEEFKEVLPFHDDFSTLLSSTLPHDDSSSSIPSSNNEWSDFYQPPEFLDPLNGDELSSKEDEMSENIKVELW